MVDILLIPLPKLQLRAPPIGPAKLKACVDEAGFTSVIEDLNIDLWHILDCTKYGYMWEENDPTFRILEDFNIIWNDLLQPIIYKWIDEKIKIHNPKYIGLSVMTQRSQYICIEVLKYLKLNYSHIQTIIGGSDVTYNQNGKRIKEKGLTDFYVEGDSELSLVELLRENFSYPGINSTPTIITDYDISPIPYYDLDHMKKFPKYFYNQRERCEHFSDTVWIIGAKGCVRNCHFCNVRALFPKYSFRTGKKVAEEVKAIVEKFPHIKRFVFTDSLINGSPPVLREFSNEIIKLYNEGMHEIRWQGSFICSRPSRMPESDYKLISEAGCKYLAIGIESGSEQIRIDMNKKFSNDDVQFTLQQCVKYNISAGLLMIVGYVTETDETFQETLQFFEDISWANKAGIIASVTMGATLTIVDGVPIYHNQEKFGIKWDDNGHWYVGDNTYRKRLQQYFTLKDHLLKLNFPIEESFDIVLKRDLQKLEEK